MIIKQLPSEKLLAGTSIKEAVSQLIEFAQNQTDSYDYCFLTFNGKVVKINNICQTPLTQFDISYIHSGIMREWDANNAIDSFIYEQSDEHKKHEKERLEKVAKCQDAINYEEWGIKSEVCKALNHISPKDRNSVSVKMDCFKMRKLITNGDMIGVNFPYKTFVEYFQNRGHSIGQDTGLSKEEYEKDNLLRAKYVIGQVLDYWNRSECPPGIAESWLTEIISNFETKKD